MDALIAPPADRDELARGILGVVEASQGMSRAALLPALTAWLALRRPAAPPPDAAEAALALGMLLLRGAVDERGGRLVSLRIPVRPA